MALFWPSTMQANMLTDFVIYLNQLFDVVSYADYLRDRCAVNSVLFSNQRVTGASTNLLQYLVLLSERELRSRFSCHERCYSKKHRWDVAIRNTWSENR